MQFDFRQIYASLLEQWLGSSSNNNASVLLNSFETVPIIGESYLSTLEWDETLKVYPNPVNGPTQLEFVTDGKPIEVELVDLYGRRLQQLYKGTPVTGFQRITWNPGKLANGQYLVVLKGYEKTVSQKVIVMQ